VRGLCLPSRRILLGRNQGEVVVMQCRLEPDLSKGGVRMPSDPSWASSLLLGGGIARHAGREMGNST